MPDQISANGPVLLRRLGAALREGRQQAKVTQEAVAKVLRCSRANVSHIERGAQEPHDHQLKAFLTCINASDDLRITAYRLLDQVRSAPRAWWDEYEDLFPHPVFSFWAFEDAAGVLFNHAGASVPGILQTREHVEALAEFYYPDESARYRARFVESRLRRFRVVERGATEMHFLFHEDALLSEVGGADVLRKQVEHLIEVAAHPLLSLRVIPARSRMFALAGPPFIILDFDTDEPSVLFSNTAKSGVLHHGGKVVEEERRRYRTVEAEALSEEESLALMKKAVRT